MSITWLGGIAVAFLLVMGFTGYQKGFIKEVFSLFLMFFSLVIVWKIQPYINEFLRENTGIYEIVYENCESLVDNTLEKNSSMEGNSMVNLMNSLPLPDMMKKNLENNNTIESYRALSANNFKEYVSGYLASALVSGLSFVISYLLTTIAIRTVAYALDLIARLPVLNGINRIVGAALGGVEGILLIWILLLILTLMCSTEIGKAGIRLVEQDTVLSFLYEHDLFVKVFMKAFTSI